jgi:pimeloyl-ACP methyl ester carboxylesterase
MRLHAVEAGEGPPIALLHGLFGRAQNLAGVARRLAPHARVISIDLRNHGASPHAPGMDYETQANDVLETLAALHALPAAILGHSMGGKTAMAAALLAPASISRLLVADIAPVPYAHHNTAVAAALLALPLTEGLTRAQASAAIEHAVPDQAVRAFLLQNLNFTPPAWRIGLANIAAAIADIEGWPALPGRYNGPALFVRGANSDYVLPEHQPAITALFPNARTVTVEASGHWLHADQPMLFGDIAERFLLDKS